MRQMEPVEPTAVTLDDEFWNPRLETNREVTIEYQYDQLESSGCLENFRRAANGETGGFEGMWFADSDAYKWLEAASYVLATTDEPDPELADRVADVIDLVAAAQDEDGYLNTYFTLEEPDKRWTNLNMLHELYCAGHLIEAAVAHHRATGDESLLEVATAFADHIDDVFPDRIDGAPGHQEIELALVKLARVTGEERYVDLAAYFVEIRGHDDRLEWELANPEDIAGYDPGGDGIVEGARGVFWEDGEYDGSYAQAHAPFEDQEAVEGHAVRAMYFFAGVADVAAETGDEALLTHLERLWENMTTKRLYITGGIGSAHEGERFTEDYDLPNETAYAETCAAIGSIFWNQRMLELTGEPKYADLIERTLYNGVLAGVSLDGTEFFYDNRLASDGSHSRSGWFHCACCPPNVARLFASLGRYLYTVDGRDCYVNQYIGGTASVALEEDDLTLTQETALPWEGDVTLEVTAPEPTTATLHLRIPEWCDDASITVNGEIVSTADESYVSLERTWDDDRIAATFEHSTTVVEGHPAVAATAGRVAITRGPLVYCLEATDNDRPIHQYHIDATTEFTSTHRAGLLDGVTVLEADATVPSLEGWDRTLYRPAEASSNTITPLTAIPYYAWDNRDAGPMRVWLEAQ
ncbi:glycoside hydrolase family 127 protein [Natronolimnobius baerhuensis]|uniref:Glycoside hydrolase family 127 protein n=1 Tax=Natronolimnobius baerhuensis TaxID=253108 RepID=A0A202E4F8_9EURY|nr:beta-L-arabinofuranosidase domain-containing protein [Natronolimnobius baerhuensis]OVE83107.1 hypothetical protein B2G88_16990 [Natronolimnobius baerhuensis]